MISNISKITVKDFLMTRFPYNWDSISTVGSASFICGYCGEKISSDKAYTARDERNRALPFIYICHVCNRPSFIRGGGITPSAALGNDVKHLPADVEQIYKEVRSSTSVNAYTVAIMGGRKLLMHVAVEKGAKKNESFIYYVDYLNDNHYTPPNSKKWADKIRELGNEVNHEIVIMNAEQALTILTFLEMLLKFIYEFSYTDDQASKPSTQSI
jgi:hypothetical protein